MCLHTYVAILPSLTKSKFKGLEKLSELIFSYTTSHRDTHHLHPHLKEA